MFYETGPLTACAEALFSPQVEEGMIRGFSSQVVRAQLQHFTLVLIRQSAFLKSSALRYPGWAKAQLSLATVRIGAKVPLVLSNQPTKKKTTPTNTNERERETKTNKQKKPGGGTHWEAWGGENKITFCLKIINIPHIKLLNKMRSVQWLR